MKTYWEIVWEIIERNCKPIHSDLKKAEFLQCNGDFTEFNFSPSELGIGGKLRHNPDTRYLWVTCYDDQLTAERHELIQNVNLELAIFVANSLIEKGEQL